MKFTEEGEVELAVVSCDAISGDSVLLVFEVRDTGIGIPEAKMGVLFSLFSQLDASSTRKHEGSGLGACKETTSLRSTHRPLGLYLTHRLVKLMNGNVTVSSDGAHGSTFRVQVMIRLSQMPVSRANTTVLSGKHVIVLARTKANRTLFEQLLPMANATVDFCLPVECGASLPESANSERLESADIVVAELSLIPALLQGQVINYRRRPLMVALATVQQYVTDFAVIILFFLETRSQQWQVEELSAEARPGATIQAPQSHNSAAFASSGVGAGTPTGGHRGDPGDIAVSEKLRIVFKVHNCSPLIVGGKQARWSSICIYKKTRSSNLNQIIFYSR